MEAILARIKAETAFYKSDDVDAIRRWAAHPDPEVRSRAIKHRLVPEDVIRLLAKDPCEIVRTDVAVHEKCPPDVFAALADDPSERVRGFVANNGVCPLDIVEKIARSDKSKWVRIEAVCNPSLPAELADRLEVVYEEFVASLPPEDQDDEDFGDMSGGSVES